ncbi:hypothetical protein M8J77_010848 [Diaphorina citri]|nr:hypothetical protein M8J77_010848 [Diaphorina citri]
MWLEQKRHPISREPSTYNTPTLDLLDAQETYGKVVSGNLSNPLGIRQDWQTIAQDRQEWRRLVGEVKDPRGL